MPFSLRIDGGPYAGRRYVFDQAEVTLGRVQENDVVVPDDGASRKHAKISQDGEGWQVEDLQSSNGTRVNGEPLKRPLTLRNGDLIQIGEVTFRFDEQMQAPNATRIVAVGDLPQWDRPSTALAKSSGGGALAMRRAAAPAGREPARGAARGAEKAGLPKNARLGLMAGGGLLGLLLLVVMVQKLSGPKGGGASADQVFDLGQKPDNRYYGLGPDVDVPSPSHAIFLFNFSEPVPGKSLLTFHCNTDAVQKPEDVEVLLNKHHLGYLPATFGDSRPVDWLLDRHMLLPNAENRIEFVNLSRPPLNWEVFGLWIEQESLPSGTPDQLQLQAKAEYDLGSSRFDNQNVAAGNLHEAWIHYKRARLVLAAMPAPPPDLVSLVNSRLHEVENALDKKCHQMLFTGQKALATETVDDALNVWHDILSYFPADDHPCNEKAHKMIQQYE